MNNPSLGIQDPPQPIFEIVVDTELVGIQVRQRTRQIATLLGFGLQDQARLSLAVSQSIHVLLQHAPNIKTELLVSLSSSSRLFIIRLGCSLDGHSGPITGSEEWISDITNLKDLADELRFEGTNSREISVCIVKKIPSEASDITLTRLTGFSSNLEPCSVSDLYKAFQQEDLALLNAVTGLQKSQGNLRELNLELENTNRGVVALYAELDERARNLRQAETALADANTRLEQRVQERTMELNVANEKLARAFKEEQTMRFQLIQAEKNSALARMVASVAHEINNPIQTIKNCIYLLKQETDPASGEAEILNMASSEATRIGDLVARLREIYRPSKEFTPRRFNLLDVLYNVHALLLPHLQHHNAHWELNSTTQSVFINGIADQLKQVFLNICLNAIDAMENKEALLTVKITSPGSSQVCISFTDTGKGISSNDLPYIFEPFFTTKDKGSGLGLSICHEIVKNMNGNITVSSSSGHGTTFTVWLPTVE